MYHQMVSMFFEGWCFGLDWQAAPPGATDKTAFLEAWSKTAPSTLNAPYFSADWLDKKADEGKDEKPAAAATPSKLTLNFYMPSGVVYKGEQVSGKLLVLVCLVD